MGGVQDIDCRVIGNYDPVYGLLAGAESKGGLWSIDLLTRDGYKRFVSSDLESEEAIVSAKGMLTGADGIVDKN
jgi:hypothetical protein